jgi:hypothetical protein
VLVCGLDREDSMVFLPARVEGRDVVASLWTPPAWTAAADGKVRREIVWVELDCPTYFAAYLQRGKLPLGFLVRMAAGSNAHITAGEESVVIAWQLGSDGRKSEAASAVLSTDGKDPGDGQRSPSRARQPSPLLACHGGAASLS